MPPAVPDPDLCVIGGGTAGHAIALAAAALGGRCTVIDPRDVLGRGQAADLAESMFFARALAVTPETSFDAAVFQRDCGRAVAAQAANHTAERLATVGVTVLHGTAAFTDPRTVVVNDRPIRARRFVLATGAEPEIPAWASALEPATLLRPMDLMMQAAPPPEIGIIAGTPAGFEWAQALRRRRCAVTLWAMPGTMAAFDPELIAPLVAALRADGIALVFDARPGDRGPPAARPLLILGRPHPRTAELALARAGIDCVDDAPVVNLAFRTSNPRVFAIGDVLGRTTPGGSAIPHQVGIVLRAALFHLPTRAMAASVPLTLRTRPPVAQVGRWDAASPARRGRVLRFPLAETAFGAATTGGGLVKVLTDGRGRVVGAGIVGAGAKEAIGTWALAVGQNLPITAMSALATPPGGVGEAGRRAALSFVTARLRSPWIKRLLRLIRHLP